MIDTPFHVSLQWSYEHSHKRFYLNVCFHHFRQVSCWFTCSTPCLTTEEQTECTSLSGCAAVCSHQQPVETPASPHSHYWTLLILMMLSKISFWFTPTLAWWLKCVICIMSLRKSLFRSFAHFKLSYILVSLYNFFLQSRYKSLIKYSLQIFRPNS